MVEPTIANPSWLDEVIAKISFIYHDEFTLVSAGKAEEYHPVHGSCQRCTYRFVFRDGIPQRLPNEDGLRLMKIIKQAAHIAQADPPLVSTKNKKGQHDFADWAWVPQGAEMWIFLEAPLLPRADAAPPGRAHS